MVKMLLFHSFKHTNAMENLVRAFLLQTLFAHLIVPKWGSVGLTPSKFLKCQFSLFGPTIIKAYMARISSMKEAYNTLGLILGLHPCLCVTLLPIFVLYDLYWWIQLLPWIFNTLHCVYQLMTDYFVSKLYMKSDWQWPFAFDQWHYSRWEVCWNIGFVLTD